MEGRCVVETLADFGLSCTPRVQCVFGSTVFICGGSNEVCVFNSKDRKHTAVLQFPGPVSDLVVNFDKQLLYAACGRGVHCVRLSRLPSRVQSSVVNPSSGPAVLEISVESLVVEEESVSSLLVVHPVLLSLSQGGDLWRLNVYKPSKQSSSGGYERLSSVTVPALSDVLHEGGGERRPVLVCVQAGGPEPPSSPSEANLHLEPVLFKLLFGIDAALLKSPVILCGLPDGRLCFAPLHPLRSKLRVLHSLEQPVVFIGASVLSGSGPEPAQCLVAVGEQGRVMLITADEAGPEGTGVGARFTEGCVAGPVLCACVLKNFLCYSTGSDLLVLDLSGGAEEPARDKEAFSRRSEALQSPSSLNVCRVVVLAQRTRDTGRALLALSSRGQLQTITLPARGEGAGSMTLPPTPTGSSAKDLLSAIGDVCDRASLLRSSIKSKDQTLKCLNHVLNISFLLSSAPEDEQQPPVWHKPIRCSAETSWSSLLRTDSLNLKCVLHNESSYVLERGWTLNIAVLPMCSSPRAPSRSAHFSFPFRALHPGETLEVSLPLAAGGASSFPVTTSCSLFFSLASLLGDEAVEKLPGSQSGCISLPLNTLTVDWLHTLQLADASPSLNATSDDTIQAFLNSRQNPCTGGGGGGGRGESTRNPETDFVSASVQISTDLLRDSIMLQSADGDAQGSKVCVAVLDWLLSEGPGGVTMGRRGDTLTVNSSVVRARAPGGHVIHLCAKEVSVGKEAESLAAVEIRVESSCMAAVCGLHHAVLRRAQTLLLKTPEKDAHTNGMQSLRLREALQRTERMLKQIQQSRIAGAFGAGQTSGSLLSVYRELRLNPLLIV